MVTLLGIGQAFELDRGMVPQAEMDAFEIVEAFDVVAANVEAAFLGCSASHGGFPMFSAVLCTPLVRTGQAVQSSAA